MKIVVNGASVTIPTGGGNPELQATVDSLTSKTSSIYDGMYQQPSATTLVTPGNMRYSGDDVLSSYVETLFGLDGGNSDFEEEIQPEDGDYIDEVPDSDASEEEVDPSAECKEAPIQDAPPDEVNTPEEDDGSYTDEAGTSEEETGVAEENTDGSDNPFLDVNIEDAVSIGDLIINGFLVGSYDSVTKVSQVIDDISEKTDVRCEYVDGKFHFTCKSPGPSHNISMDSDLAIKMFANPDAPNTRFGAAYSMTWLKEGRTATMSFKFPSRMLTLTVAYEDTVSDIAKSLSTSMAPSGYTVIPNAYTGEIEVKRLGVASDFTVSDEWGKKCNFSNQYPDISYTIGKDGIFTGIKANGAELTQVDKAFNITIPTRTSELTNNSNFITQSFADNRYLGLSGGSMTGNLSMGGYALYDFIPGSVDNPYYPINYDILNEAIIDLENSLRDDPGGGDGNDTFFGEKVVKLNVHSTIPCPSANVVYTVTIEPELSDFSTYGYALIAYRGYLVHMNDPSIIYPVPFLSSLSVSVSPYNTASSDVPPPIDPPDNPPTPSDYILCNVTQDATSNAINMTYSLPTSGEYEVCIELTYVPIVNQEEEGGA